MKPLPGWPAAATAAHARHTAAGGRLIAERVVIRHRPEGSRHVLRARWRWPDGSEVRGTWCWAVPPGENLKR